MSHNRLQRYSDRPACLHVTLPALSVRNCKIAALFECKLFSVSGWDVTSLMPVHSLK